MDLGFPLVAIFGEVGNSEREFLAIPGWLWGASLRRNWLVRINQVGGLVVHLIASFWAVRDSE